MQRSLIDLVVFSEADSSSEPIEWHSGGVNQCPALPVDAYELIDRLLRSDAEFVLFWDQQLGNPDEDFVRGLMHQSIDVWHAGLKLGTQGQPESLDFVCPTWTFNKDPSFSTRAMSWRLSLRACLIKKKVLRELGQIDRAFTNLDYAGLEMGYRYIWRGAVIVNEPGLINDPIQLCSFISSQDSYVFIQRHYKNIWVKYALCRSILGSGKFIREIKDYKNAIKKILQKTQPIPKDRVLIRETINYKSQSKYQISVLIPTICRYPYLEQTLNFLNEQTIKPDEVICIDQTPLNERRPELYHKFSDLNIKLIWMDNPGQCSARNAGLNIISGDLILFMDDDVIIGPNYIQSLLEGLRLYQADIVQGVWDQSTGEAIALTDRYYRVSDRFAAGNGMATREILSKVGGFDLNYDRNYRADADIGMRLYLSGAVSIIVPGAKEHSLSPPTGGLKYYGASGAINRIKILRPWPPVTQTYYWLRYFRKNQVKEAMFITLISSFIPNNFVNLSTKYERFNFIIKAFLKFPFRVISGIKSFKKANELLKHGPKIPPGRAVKS